MEFPKRKSQLSGKRRLAQVHVLPRIEKGFVDFQLLSEELCNLKVECPIRCIAFEFYLYPLVFLFVLLSTQSSRGFLILALTLTLACFGPVWMLCEKCFKLAIKLQLIVYRENDEVEKVLPLPMGYTVADVVPGFRGRSGSIVDNYHFEIVVCDALTVVGL